MPNSLYIHIPFCFKKCNYCNFISYPNSEHLVPSYIDALKKEIKFYSDFLNKPYICTIYFGGGTPTYLEIKYIKEIFDEIKACFNLTLNYEASIEANPGTVNLQKLILLKEVGINRLSVGAQSFKDEHLRILGRTHTESQIYYTFNSARMASFQNISLDLIFGIPDQTLPDWMNTLSKAISLAPEHISTYCLKIEEGTPFYKERGNLNLVGEDIECLMFDETINALKASGFEHYEISSFAWPNFRCRHNETYWKNEEYIGAGAGATSYIAGHRYSNHKKINDYIKYWEEISKVPLRNKLKNKKGANLGETIFLGLRLTEGIDIEQTGRKFGVDLMELYKNEIKELLKEGLIQLNSKNLKLSRRGLPLADYVFERFV